MLSWFGSGGHVPTLCARASRGALPSSYHGGVRGRWLRKPPTASCACTRMDQLAVIWWSNGSLV